MPGRRNPIGITSMFERMHGAAYKAKDKAHDVAGMAKEYAQEMDLHVSYVDLEIQFIGASGLPKMDLGGLSDPYFVATLDDKIKFISTVQPHTLNPVWNDLWRVKNVPVHASLNVQVLDKDDGTPTDDYIGKFSTSISPGTKEVEIEGPLFKRDRGTFWVKIESKPSTNDPHLHQYVFDGPVRYSRHFSPLVGRLTSVNDDRLYCTWKMYIKGVRLFFGERTQHWNVNYKAAQTIFQGATSLAVRSGIQAGHRMLYARSTTNGFGVITAPADILAILHGGNRRGQNDTRFEHRVKPAVYTYIIAVEDDSLRFSETGAAFFVDFASKHALHSNCAEAVRYSGEFHPRPKGGWENFSDDTPDTETEWELVIDNNSGTYAPDKTLLPDLKALLEYNFPGFRIFALDREDPQLEQSREACRAYAIHNRGVKNTELQPHTEEGEPVLSHEVEAQGHPAPGGPLT
ncbi:hypothetical protein OE88DRAFT_1708179 [Heliocybe sulcata]|uniref:C2 domain-containing protein n=1 Tax=Heliocybe sulcata TaxID=5364 RepID=A0A5C3MKJ3_9AGAM|nr:hypothetical protein OE88DRAFT_1708179 [Heliocybe sulcata]